MKLMVNYPRHRIAIQENVPARDTDGAEVDNWTTRLEAWASIEPLLGREYLAAQSTQAEVSHRVRMRYQPGVEPAMRILYGSRAFDILSVLDVEELHRELVLMCMETL